ncbi:MAG: hypothetical protein ACJ790_22345 [Myxococcaceae bacterium]
MRQLGLLAVASLILACSGNSGGNDGGGGGTGGGAGGGGGTAQNQGISVLDPASTEKLPVAMAVGPNDRVGVAYFVKIGLSATRSVPPNDAGFDPGGASDYEIRYVEWRGGTASAPQKIQTVQRPFGLTVAFQPNGEPAVAYLGGGDDQSIYWFQSDAAISYRSNGTTWTEQIAVTHGDEALCGNSTCAPISDRGFLVGLNPALVIDGTSSYLFYRDGHDGQFPQQDWAGSDLELAQGGTAGGTWTHAVVAAGGAGGASTAKPGWGGHLEAILASGKPVVISDHVLGSADGVGHGVYLHSLSGTTWTTQELVNEQTASNNQTGPSLAWTQASGYGVAWVNRNQDSLNYISSANGTSWSVPDTAFQNGTGGWYPSLAFDPVTGQPTIAFYVCSIQSGKAEGNCPVDQDDLRVTTRGGDGTSWNETVIDTEGGYMPKLGFLSTGKRVIAYRAIGTYQVKLYVEP